MLEGGRFLNLVWSMCDITLGNNQSKNVNSNGTLFHRKMDCGVVHDSGIGSKVQAVVV